MNERNQEKPSPILMLAPIAIVLLGYHYLFHSKISSDLSTRRQQLTELQDRTQNIQREQSMLLGQLGTAKTDLESEKQQSSDAKEELALAVAAKAELRSRLQGSTNESVGQANADSETPKGDSSTPLDALTTVLTSIVSVPVDNPSATSAIVDADGECALMSSICSILDANRLMRLESSDPSSKSNGLIDSERTELGSLLAITLPPISRHQLRLEGSFIDLIAALHELNDRLPAVTVVSLSLEPVDIQTMRYIWKLEVGIRG
ncbi:MAG: hypothetical protein AAGG48_04800 [Planctomycetota bacterium]